MKFRTTLIAALLLILFGTYAYFFEYKKVKEEEEKKEKAKKVFSLDWETLKGFTIKNSNGNFLIEKAGKGSGEGDSENTAKEEWRILEPVKTDADSTALNGMVGSLKKLDVEQVVDEAPANLAPFGLDHPGIEIGVLLSKDGENPPLLKVGFKSPVGQNSYAQKQGEKKVFLLSAYLDPQFNKNLFDLREKKIFGFSKDNVETVRVFHEGKPQVEIAREDGTWRITRPIHARASESEVTGFLNKLKGLRAQSFPAEKPENLSPYGLDAPQWQVDVSLSPDHARASLLLGKAAAKEGEGYVYAKRGETSPVVSLKGDILETLDLTPEELREKKVFPYQSWKVEKVGLDWKKENVILEKRDNGKWWITDPIEARASAGKISPFLSSLSRLEGEEFIDKPGNEKALAAYGLDHPLVKITLYEKDEKAGQAENGEKSLTSLGTLLLAKAPGNESDRYYAMLQGSDTLARIGGDFVRKNLPKDMESLREKKLLDFFRYQVGSFDYEGPEGDVILLKNKGKWEIKKPVSREAEEKDVNSLLSGLTDLEADRFVNEKGKEVMDAGGLKDLGLDPPERRVVLKNEEGNELGTLLFSGSGPKGEEGTVFVQQKGDSWIGVVSKEKVDLLLEKLSPFLAGSST